MPLPAVFIALFALASTKAENTARFAGDIVDYLSIMMSPPTTFTANPTWIQAINVRSQFFLGELTTHVETSILVVFFFHGADHLNCYFVAFKDRL